MPEGITYNSLHPEKHEHIITNGVYSTPKQFTKKIERSINEYL